MDLAHPLGIAPRQIVVHGDDVHAATGERVQIGRAAWRPGSCPRPSSSRRCCRGAGSRRRSAGRRSDAGRACAWPPRGPWRTPRAADRRAARRGAIRSRKLRGPGARAPRPPSCARSASSRLIRSTSGRIRLITRSLWLPKSLLQQVGHRARRSPGGTDRSSVPQAAHAKRAASRRRAESRRRREADSRRRRRRLNRR